MMLLAAKGLLPFAQDQVLPILIRFAGGPDEELKGLSRQTLGEYPAAILSDFVDRAAPEDLANLADCVDDPAVLERMALAKAASDALLQALAARAPERVQAVIVANQARILACPAILDALQANPGLSPDIQRRITELREEFFGEKKAFVPSITDEEAKDLGISPQQYMDLFDSFQLDSLPEDQLFSAIHIPEGEMTEEEQSLFQRVIKMSVPEKIELALKGSQEARSLLMNDSNKLVKEAVIKSPRITEPEISLVAANRSVDEESLRLIGTDRKWVRKYVVVRNLCFNPKTPVGITLSLLPRLMKKDLKDLGREKNVPDPVRTTAHRLYLVRAAS
jgi:hypothetical protein